MSEIKLPSGLALEIRGMLGMELRILQDRVAAKNGTYIDKILSACTSSVTDAGPYADLTEGSVPVWDKCLLGDKLATVIGIRSATFGPEFSFKTQCPDCHKRFEWSLNLTDLETKKLSDEDAAAFRTGIPFETTIPGDGRTVKFRLPLGEDEREAAKSRSAENAMVSMMSRRIFEIDGETDKSKIRKILEECGLASLTRLLKLFDKRDCGVETEIQTECPDCFSQTDVQLPLGRAFWLET